MAAGRPLAAAVAATDAARRCRKRRRCQSAATLLAASAATLLSGRLAADAPPERSTVGLRVSRYAEDDLQRYEVLDGAATGRYTIDIRQLAFATPLGSRFALSADVIRETMTGASPLGAVKLADDDVRVTMSGASIREERTDIALGGAWYGDATTVRLGAGRSVENDYEADYASAGIDITFNDDTSTLGFAVSASDDVLTPTDASLYNRVRRAEKQARSAFLGFTQVVSKNVIVQTGIGFNRLEGYLSDPYKAGNIAFSQDSRPGEREQWTWTFGSRQFMQGIETAFQFDYRYYRDDWGIESHTVRPGLERQFGDDWRFGISLRWYMQTEADFYEPYMVPLVELPEHFSMDYRLSPYGAISVNVDGRWEFAADWFAVFVFERYKSAGEFSAENVQLENPGLVDFLRGSLGLEYRF